MNSFIITGADTATRAKYLGDLCNSPTELIHLIAEKTTITIKQIKDLWAPLSLISRIKRIVWIEEANLLTIPAQNALLKMLEEPPHNTSFYLSCKDATSLIPTIRSRAKITQLNQVVPTTDQELLRDLKLQLSLSLGDRLASLPKQDRSTALAYFQTLESSLSLKLQEKDLKPQSLQTLAKIAHLAQQTHLHLLHNVSVSLALQNFYLSLPKLK